ncbi:uncharacterized protein LOC6533524 [Drosophila yakuba]|uniref:Chitin-binding type-2 domain-containing protein n=1 Tax=Drosophila yakuba TaxID=7245 RepID=B4PDG6_DROYA|nr:uncharacterized protein LOC6533524 [Drosophila yakuba]EDW93946.2 uncharacterized protein Dyak_GE20310 [Drosophila yakuba]
MDSSLLFICSLVFLLFQMGKGLENGSYREQRLDAATESCPDDFYFNETIKACVSTDSTSCTNHQIAKCPMATEVDKYCLCLDKHLQIWQCPEGAYFDANRLVCRMGTVECQEEYAASACPNSTANDVFCLCIDGKWQLNYCPSGYTYDAKLGICLMAASDGGELPSSSGKCQRFGLFGDPADCSGYYHCRDKGSDIEYYRCSGGTIFNLISFACVAGAC